VLGEDEQGGVRAQVRAVASGPSLGPVVVIESGLEPGERVAAAGSFKLREGALVAIAGESSEAAH
jgi:membrane fusion protein (multidrug efflux system)